MYLNFIVSNLYFTGKRSSGPVELINIRQLTSGPFIEIVFLPEHVRLRYERSGNYNGNCLKMGQLLKIQFVIFGSPPKMGLVISLRKYVNRHMRKCSGYGFKLWFMRVFLLRLVVIFTCLEQ